VSFFVGAVLYGLPTQSFDLIYGKGLLTRLNVGAGSNDYIVFRVNSADSCEQAKKAFQKGESDVNPKTLEPIIFFFIYGNKGQKFQF